TTSVALPSTSPNGSRRSPSPTKSSSPAPSPTSSLARASRSLIAAPTRSKASPTHGRSSPSKTHSWDPTPCARTRWLTPPTENAPNEYTERHRTSTGVDPLWWTRCVKRLCVVRSRLGFDGRGPRRSLRSTPGLGSLAPTAAGPPRHRTPKRDPNDATEPLDAV